MAKIDLICKHKTIFNSRDDALKEADKRYMDAQGTPVPYVCSVCNRWHLTGESKICKQ